MQTTSPPWATLQGCVSTSPQINMQPITEVVLSMIPKNPTFLIALAVLLAGISACQDDRASTASPATAQSATDNTSVAAQPVATSSTTSPGKPTAPIDISYEVIGNAIVGSPVSINIVVTSDRGPVTVQYSIVDRSALMFQTGQVQRRDVLEPSSRKVQQLAVIPQREGRAYVNVSAEIPTADGLNIRSISIPIQVGSAPDEPTANGEMVEGPDGETVNSMPAQESN